MTSWNCNVRHPIPVAHAWCPGYWPRTKFWLHNISNSWKKKERNFLFFPGFDELIGLVSYPNEVFSKYLQRKLVAVSWHHNCKQTVNMAYRKEWFRWHLIKLLILSLIGEINYQAVDISVPTTSSNWVLLLPILFFTRYFLAAYYCPTVILGMLEEHFYLPFYFHFRRV